MGAGAKIIGGLILILIGLGLFMDSVIPIIGTGVQWVSNFIIVLTGIIPILLIIIGLFIVWLEIDELKVQRELEREEQARKTEKKKNNKK
ncbi:MAG: hypothetical protein KKG59_01980 [Nanoarchaeota archaeon]|nr:hypothetical protein [Nanoarchaeota archaeon]